MTLHAAPFLFVDHESDIGQLVKDGTPVGEWPSLLRCIAIDWQGKLDVDIITRFGLTTDLIAKMNVHCGSGRCRHMRPA